MLMGTKSCFLLNDDPRSGFQEGSDGEGGINQKPIFSQTKTLEVGFCVLEEQED
jgi:hypothetical protein